VYSTKSIGPSTDPCGTPHLRTAESTVIDIGKIDHISFAGVEQLFLFAAALFHSDI